MIVVKPSNGVEDNGLYRSPSASPLKIYSYQALYGEYPFQGNSQYDYAYRVFIYNYDDYDASIRKGNTYDDIDIPNSKMRQK